MTPTTRSDLANTPDDMHIFEGRYFNINRKLLMCLGLWPYVDKTKKYVIRAIVMCILGLGYLGQLASIFLYYKDIDRLMLGVLDFCVLLVVSSKMMAMILAEKDMRLLHRSIANNWQRIQDYRERDILHKYSEKARSVTTIYVAVIVSSGFVMAVIPLIPKFLDLIRPLGNPRPNIYVTASEILIDRETYFALFLLFEYIEFMVIAMVIITIDTMYIVIVEHCCASYAIVRSRLLELRPILQTRLSSEAEAVDSYEWLRRTIRIHQDARTFSLLLNKSYSRLFLFMAVSVVFVIPFNSCAIIANLDNPLQLLPYVVFLVNVMVHGFVASYPGQRIVDHQLSLLDAAYCNEWYTVPLRTRKLLFIFMLRCSQPVMITIGDLVPMNLEIYFKVMKTSVSYITVASSFR